MPARPRDLPHPDAAPLPPSAQTPRTQKVVTHARTFGQQLRRNLSAVLAFAGAAGIGLAQLIQSSQAVKAWVEAVGLWPSFGLAALGLFALHVASTRHVLREALDTLRASAERQQEVLERQMERDRNLFQEALERIMRGTHEEAETVAREVRELRERMGPRISVAREAGRG